MLHDFADTVNALEGRYRTAEDVGTSADDMAVIAERTKYVAGLGIDHGGSGDPSPHTALGVVCAMRAACERRFGSADLGGRTVAVVGLGRVGSNLARLLAGQGAELIVADIDEGRRALLDELGGRARWADPTVALLAEVDVLAPCALGGVIDEPAVERLRCEIVCGAANNQLAHEGLADDLHQRGILYAPDFIANAGGIVNISVELEGYDPDEARRRVEAIEGTIGSIFDEAAAAGITPLAAAYERARRRLGEAG